MKVYSSQGVAVMLIHSVNDIRLMAICATPGDACKAAALLNRALFANDVKRQYTKAAQLINVVENLPGFKWVEDDE